MTGRAPQPRRKKPDDWDGWQLHETLVHGETVSAAKLVGDPPVPAGGEFLVSSDGQWGEVWGRSNENGRVLLRIYLRQKKFQPGRRRP